MRFAVFVTATPAHATQLPALVSSLTTGLVRPEKIYIVLPTDKKYVIDNPTRKTPTVEIVRVDRDLGTATVLQGLLEECKAGEDIYCVLLNANCTYPRNYLADLQQVIPELERQVRSKLESEGKTYNGTVVGLAGQTFVVNKESTLDKEFDALLSGDSETTYEKRTLIGYSRENATMDILDLYGGIVFHRSQLGPDFKIDATEDVDFQLSNYFAGKNILRTQICTLTLNRYMLDALGFTVGRQPRPKAQKETDYEKMVLRARKEGRFHLWA